MSTIPPESLVGELAETAAELTGFSREAIRPEAIRRAAASLLTQESPETLRARLVRRDRAVVHALCQAVSVGETYFFRHPHHFRFVAEAFIPERLAQGATAIRAWSAGCATGEEAYSLAACLLGVVAWPGTVSLEVLATDLVSRNLAVARGGSYGSWSQRPTGPLLYPLLARGAGAEGKVRVLDRLREIVRFIEHNLLDPLDEGPFDLIFCRNVLVYFSAEASRRAVRHLIAALRPGGALVLGSMDLPDPPPGLVPHGLPEQQIWIKPDRSRPSRPTRAETLPRKAVEPLPILPPPPKPPPEPVALHLRALVHIERGDKKTAQGALEDLTRDVPDYVPGYLERALLHGRSGERSQAANLMREVLRRTERLAEEEMIPGPELLPVRFYRESAQTFLRGAER